ncbi:hypothetical protein BGZ51_000994, partial [Haplosporangium sp. Z 767]
VKAQLFLGKRTRKRLSSLSKMPSAKLLSFAYLTPTSSPLSKLMHLDLPLAPSSSKLMKKENLALSPSPQESSTRPNGITLHTNKNYLQSSMLSKPGASTSMDLIS